jgi:thiosulfate/3-mercaptopyruvate sulfurtransferase
LVITAVTCVPADRVFADQCLECHTNAETLAQVVRGLPEAPPLVRPRAGDLPPMSRVERVLVTEEYFDDYAHSDLYCDECHGGDPEAADFEAAHADVVRDPSYPAPGICADCHEQPETFENSLHYTIAGMEKALMERVGGNPADKKTVMQGFQANCADCHASCGQCHVSRPQVAGGGLVNGHAFTQKVSLEENCFACHGKTIGAEWRGDGKGLKPDVHNERVGMYCEECHTVDQLHGDFEEDPDMAHTSAKPQCVNCHEAIFTDQSEYKEVHSLHKGRTTCYVCHSQAYNNCSGCHVHSYGGAELEAQWSEFKIGRNPFVSDASPEKFVTVRKTPVNPGLFKFFAHDLLDNYESRPSWLPTSPHNIRRKTKQNRSCNSCHGVWDLFLMRQEVEKEERPANRTVIVAPGQAPKEVEE